MKNFLMILCTLILFLGLVGNASADPIQWTDNGHYYEVVIDTMNWTDASASAQSRTYNGVAGHLATITSMGENDFIFTALGIGNKPYWLGGFQEPGSKEKDVDWQWVTGEDWDYTNWAGGEPNNSTWGEEDSLAFAFFRADGTWNDAPTTYEYSNGGFVIEYDTAPVPEPATIFLMGLGLFGMVGIRRRMNK